MTKELETIAAQHGWFPIIHARGLDAYLVNVQPLRSGDVLPIYRWPSGDKIASQGEAMQDAERFNDLSKQVRKSPMEYLKNKETYIQCPVDWAREFALAAMEVLNADYGDDIFKTDQYILFDAGRLADELTEFIFEEQTQFDPYEENFVNQAEWMLHWYVRRYTKD